MIVLAQVIALRVGAFIEIVKVLHSSRAMRPQSVGLCAHRISGRLTAGMLAYKTTAMWERAQTYQKRPPASASNATPPIAIPTIAPVDRPDESSELPDESSDVASAALASDVLELVGASVTVTVVALDARDSMDV